LPVGTAYVAALRWAGEAEEERLERLDYSLESWEAGARPEGLFSYWKTVAADGEGKQRRMLVDDAVLLDLFERLGSDEGPQRAAFRFVLGLILMRKKLLRMVGRSESCGEMERWLLLPRGADPSSPPLEMCRPELSEEDIAELTSQLGEILQTEL
jgi:hypothetical protein